MEKEYKKTYKPLIILFISYMIVLIAGLILLEKYIPIKTKDIMILILAVTVLLFDILFFIMYKGEYVYWLSGRPTFEEAKSVKSEVRKKFAFAHLKIFLILTALCVIYIPVSYIIHLSYLVDLYVIMIAIVVSVVMTTPIKFENYKRIEKKKYTEIEKEDENE
ncbi:MAG: hypothetical protein HFI37_02475 [Lachnospiraceae bacterium]|nr:hypothetical protein [Lachnospiraceae bacterium]